MSEFNAVDVSTQKWQCPECGVPVDVVHLQHRDSAVVDLAPCGHETSLEVFG